MKTKEPKKKPAHDPMMPKSGAKTQQTIKRNLENYIRMLEQSHWNGRILTNEAKDKINEAISFGIEVNENVKGYL